MYVYSKGEIMEDKLYAKDLRRAAKRLERKIEPDDETKAYDILNMDMVKKGIDFLTENNNLPHRDIEIPEYITPEMIKKAVKRLMKHKIKPDSDGLITIENPRIFRGKLISITDFFKR